jgi:hypothetical protein
MRGWEPGHRVWNDELAAEPFEWLGRQLADLDALVAGSDVDQSEIHPHDAQQLRDAVPEILATVRTLLERVRSGDAGRPPADYEPTGEAVLARSGWL